MKVQAIASDFDGTILRPGEPAVREELFEIIPKLRDQGIDFIAATGRPYANVRRLMKPVAEQISYVCENGALIVCEGRIIYKSVIEREIALELIGAMERVEGTDIVVSGEDTLYMLPDNIELITALRERSKNNITLINDHEDIRRDMIKISIHWPLGIPEEEKQRFQQKFGTRLQIVEGGNCWLDFTNFGTNKGEALRILTEKMNYQMEQLVSLGDSENDISMLQETGYSYAMHTAREEVKKAADAVCFDAVETIKSYCSTNKTPER